MNHFHGSSAAMCEPTEQISAVDAVYLFACHLQWRRTKDAAAHRALLSALHHPDDDIRLVAQVLLADNQILFGNRGDCSLPCDQPLVSV